MSGAEEEINRRVEEYINSLEPNVKFENGEFIALRNIRRWELLIVKVKEEYGKGRLQEIERDQSDVCNCM